MGVSEGNNPAESPGGRWMRLVGSRSLSVDPCQGHGVSSDLNKFPRLGLGQMGQNVMVRTSLVLFPRTDVKGERGSPGTGRDYEGVYGGDVLFDTEDKIWVPLERS